MEQIVLGYLAAGRSGAQSDVLAARAATDGGLPADPEVSADARPVTLADAAILDALAEGLDAAALIERHPGLTQAAIRAACRRAADRARSVGSASPGADR